MKQGQATTSIMGSTKVEPKSKAVNVSYVAECGIHGIRYGSIPMYEGRGLEAPMAGSETHPRGSQGKHK
jgi:hypothetical protein